MREVPESRINFPVLLFVIALHAVVAAYAMQAPAPRFEPPTRHGASAPPEPAPAATPATPQIQPGRDNDATPLDADAAIDDPRRAFSPQQVQRNQAAAAQAQDRRRLGPLAAQTATSAQWPAALAQRLRAGDGGAAGAAAELHDDCDELGGAPPPATVFDEALVHGLDASMQALVRSEFEARVQRLAERHRRCAAWRAARDDLAAARRDYAARADADAFEKLRTRQQLDPPTPSLLERLRRELRALWESQSQSRVGRALALQLLNDDNEAGDRLGLQLLLQLAERDDTQVEFVASVLSQGYGRLPPQPDLAPQWQQRAAELGADAAIDAQLASAAPAQAWAWRAWRVWLNAHGCYVDAPRAQDAVLAADLRALQQLDGALSPGARAEAGRVYLERTQRYGDRARAVRDCATDG